MLEQILVQAYLADWERQLVRDRRAAAALRSLRPAGAPAWRGTFAQRWRHLTSLLRSGVPPEPRADPTGTERSTRREPGSRSTVPRVRAGGPRRRSSVHTAVQRA